MLFGKVARVFVPAGAFLAMPAMIPRLHAKEMVHCEKCCHKRLPKASELSLYEQQADTTQMGNIAEKKGSLEDGISTVRKQLAKYISAMDATWQRVAGIYNTGLAHSRNTYDYITEEENFVPRVLTIASGGLIGMFIAARGGVFKKITYSSVGVTAVAAACYPKEAKQYTLCGFHAASQKSSNLLKEYAGYDIEKIAHETEKKVGSFKATINFQNITNTTKEWMNKIYLLEKMGKQNSDASQTAGDLGQSNPKDADLYTTR